MIALVKLALLLAALVYALHGPRTRLGGPVAFPRRRPVRRIPLARAGEMVRKGTLWHLILFVMGLYLFKNILDVSGVPVDIAHFLQGQGIPVLLAIMLIPMILALATGVNQAFVSLGIPLLLPLTHDPKLLVIGFAAGFTGIMLSPIHLCLLLTADYFKTDFLALFRKLLLPGLATLGLGTVFWLLV